VGNQEEEEGGREKETKIHREQDRADRRVGMTTKQHRSRERGRDEYRRETEDGAHIYARKY